MNPPSTHPASPLRVSIRTPRSLWLPPVLVTLAALTPQYPAAPIVRNGAGANPAAIQTAVEQFRADLGGTNNGAGRVFKIGRREINWDGVPNAFAAPNFLPANFFHVTSPRGIVFTSPGSNAGDDTSNFIVSANSTSGTAVRFGDLDPSYSAIFQTFSAERLFTVRGSNDNSTVITAQFFVPGTSIPAGVKGFGAVFVDVDSSINAIVRVYGITGALLTSPASVAAANNGLSFLGISFNAGEQIARVEILCGNRPLKSGTIDGTGGVDVITMDDVIYGEPQPLVLPVPATATLSPTVIEVHVPAAFNAVSQMGVPTGFFRTFLRCCPHHTYRFFSSTDLMNWTPVGISGNVIGPDSNLLDPRSTSTLYQAASLGVEVDLVKSGPNRYFRAVDLNNGDTAATPLVP